MTMLFATTEARCYRLFCLSLLRLVLFRRVVGHLHLRFLFIYDTLAKYFCPRGTQSIPYMIHLSWLRYASLLQVRLCNTNAFRCLMVVSSVTWRPCYRGSAEYETQLP